MYMWSTCRKSFETGPKWARIGSEFRNGMEIKWVEMGPKWAPTPQPFDAVGSYMFSPLATAVRSLSNKRHVETHECGLCC